MCFILQQFNRAQALLLHPANPVVYVSGSYSDMPHLFVCVRCMIHVFRSIGMVCAIGSFSI